MACKLDLDYMAHWQRRQPTQMRIAPTIAAAVIRPAYKGFIGIVDARAI